MRRSLAVPEPRADEDSDAEANGDDAEANGDEADEPQVGFWSSSTGSESLVAIAERAKLVASAGAAAGASTDVPTRSSRRFVGKSPVLPLKVKGLSDDGDDDADAAAPTSGDVLVCSGYKCHKTSGQFTITN